jgi:hypothetical protein
MTLLFAGILTGYIQMGRQAEWAGYSLAAQASGLQVLEQAHSAVWDYSIQKNEVTNLNLLAWTYNTTTKVGTGYSTNVLDVPISGNNVVMVTNFVTVKMVSLTGNPSVQVQMVKVETVWPLASLNHSPRLHTNTVATYLGPDNRDRTSL